MKPTVILEHPPHFTLLNCHNRVPQTGWLNNRNMFFTVLEARSSRWRCQLIQFLMTALFLPCRQPPPHCVHMVEREWVLVFLLIKSAILLDWGPTFITSFNLHYLHKGLISRYSHVGGWSFNIGILGRYDHLVHNILSSTLSPPKFMSFLHAKTFILP